MGSTPYPPFAPPGGGTPHLQPGTPEQGSGQPQPMQPGEYKGAAIANLISFLFDKVDAPSSLYLQQDDTLLLEAASAAPETVTFNIRFLQAPMPKGGQPSDANPAVPTGYIYNRGIVQPIQETINFTTSQPNNLQNQGVVLGEGYLLSVSAIATNQRSRGLVFARAAVCRGSASFVSANAYQILFADYPTNNHAVGWPGGRQTHPSEGPGSILRATIGNPAAGADFAFQPADALRWRVQSLIASLTTSATVANRQVHSIVADASGNRYWNEAALAVQAASLTVVYSFGPGLTPQTTTDGVQVVGLPANLILAQRHQIQSLTTALQAGDQWSLIAMGVEQLEDLI